MSDLISRITETLVACLLKMNLIKTMFLLCLICFCFVSYFYGIFVGIGTSLVLLLIFVWICKFFIKK